MKHVIGKVVEYKIVGDHTKELVEEQVSEFLARNSGQNWVPCGGISCGSIGDRVTCFVQALVRLEYKLINVTKPK